MRRDRGGSGEDVDVLAGLKWGSVLNSGAVVQGAENGPANEDAKKPAKDP